MKIGPKYKIARKLKAPIFEKTQTQKFALRSDKKTTKRTKPKSDFGLQLNEKQKARMFYGITEKQFKNYVKKALDKKGTNPSLELMKSLETRLDNTVWRAGLAPTHMAARQAVAHGHFLLNGRRVYIPSIAVKIGDSVTIREGSMDSKLFTVLSERATTLPTWVEFDQKSKSITIKDAEVENNDPLFDLGQVIEYYQR